MNTARLDAVRRAERDLEVSREAERKSAEQRILDKTEREIEDIKRGHDRKMRNTREQEKHKAQVEIDKKRVDAIKELASVAKERTDDAAEKVIGPGTQGDTGSNTPSRDGDNKEIRN